MRILECSSKGDRRFSAFYAKISFYGKIDSIEHIYQSVKRDKNGDLVNKGKKAEIRYVMSNSLGFGGHNGALIFKKWEGK